MTEARAGADLTLRRVVDEFDGGELVPGQLEHGQVAQGGLGDAADDLVADGRIERQRSVKIGDTQAEVQRPHRFPSLGRTPAQSTRSLPGLVAMTNAALT